MLRILWGVLVSTFRLAYFLIKKLAAFGVWSSEKFFALFKKEQND